MVTTITIYGLTIPVPPAYLFWSDGQRAMWLARQKRRARRAALKKEQAAA